MKRSILEVLEAAHERELESGDLSLADELRELIESIAEYGDLEGIKQASSERAYEEGYAEGWVELKERLQGAFDKIQEVWDE